MAGSFFVLGAHRVQILGEGKGGFYCPLKPSMLHHLAAYSG